MTEAEELRYDVLASCPRYQLKEKPCGECPCCRAAAWIEEAEKTIKFREQQVRDTIGILEALRQDKINEARAIVDRMETHSS